MNIKLELKFPKLDETFKVHQNEIMLVLAAAMQTNRAMMFDKEGADNGKPKWAPLKFRRGRILQDTGTLRKSFAPPNDGNKPGHGPGSVVRITGENATIGTSLGYARLMNDGTTKMPGGVLRPVNAQALKIPINPGELAKMQGTKSRAVKHDMGAVRIDNKNFIFRKWVKIPARPMDEITAQDEQEWCDTVANYIGELLSRGDRVG
jgi:phage gpG-like protein